MPTVVAVELCTMEAPVTVKEVNAVVPPTAPVIVTVPPVPPANVKTWVPLTVLEIEMFAPAAVAPPFVVSAATSSVKVTGPVQPIAPPLVVRLPAKLMMPV